MRGKAIFSKDRTYRYLLSRQWEEWEASGHRTIVTWIMLNPSTADAAKNDPTIRRCIHFCQQMGAGKLYVVNLFALRTPEPRDLAIHPKPIGKQNSKWIRWAVDRSDLVIVAWGSNGIRYKPRVRRVLKIIGYPFERTVYCLGRTANKHPRHPLMLANNTELEEY